MEGLGILRERSLRIPPKSGTEDLHMGWNSLHIQNSGRLFKDIPENTYVYFVHSYYLQSREEEIVKATTQSTVHASMHLWRREMYLHASSTRKKAAGGA